VDFCRHAGGDLDDRYVLADDQIVQMGHGLKDVGNKDSFIVSLDKILAGDLLASVRASFDAKWQNAIAFV
jgi:hypothetical protein